MIEKSSLMIRVALAPLACGLALDIFTVILTATDRPTWAFAGAIAAFILLITLWFVFPLHAKRVTRLRKCKAAAAKASGVAHGATVD